MLAAGDAGFLSAAYTFGMTYFDQSQHPRNAAGTSTGGQFAAKANSVPEIELPTEVDDPVLALSGDDILELPTLLHEYNSFIRAFSADAKLDSGDPTQAIITLGIHENLLSMAKLANISRAELDKHRNIVEDVYREWFDAEIEVDSEHDWDEASVYLSVQVPRNEARERALADGPIWDASAKYLSETDPGTYGALFVGAEIRRRIDAAKEAQNV